jgi:hypothetical protein
MMKRTYLTVTTQIRDQMIIETAGTTICSAVPPFAGRCAGIRGRRRGARPDITEDDPEGRDGGRQGQRLDWGGACGRLRFGRAHGELFTVSISEG